MASGGGHFNTENRMSAHLFALLLVCWCIGQSQGGTQEKSVTDGDGCTSRKSCRECLVADPVCAWCSMEEFPHARCDVLEQLNLYNCHPNNITNYTSSVHYHKDKPLSDPKPKSRSSGATIQLKPQKVKLTTRIGEVLKLDVKFKQAEDYPVDLYYLMDLTHSMRDHKTKLYELGESLVKAMESMTRNFRMGFGSFVDKAVMPYVDISPAKLENPCPDKKICVAPYGFRNHMSLSNDTNNFKREVKEAGLSGNLDDAEGGFDALMQVIVCGEAIKWKEEARKIVLFATDSGFHYAGDGKVGGVVKPNDEICHLDQNGYYTESKMQDYPSLSQINRQILTHRVNLLFAVPDAVSDLYRRLSEAIEGALMGTLSDDHSNIVELINNQYAKIRSSVILKDDAPDFVRVTYGSRCQGMEMMATNQCDNMTVGKTVDFEVNVTVERCPEKIKDRKFSFKISPVGLSDTLEVEMDLICECKCGELENRDKSSPRCNMSGTYECGVCLCDERRYGKYCECNIDTEDTTVHTSRQSNCSPPNSTVLCSRRGECLCGQCICSKTEKENEYYGPYCECNDNSCVFSNDKKMCGGREKGKCICGKCKCKPGWSKEDCACSTATNHCSAGNDTVPCSGNGVCECNSCICNETDEGRFSGLYCEECPTCKGRCQELNPCIECEFQRRSPKATNMECAQCSKNMVRSFTSNRDELLTGRKCTYLDDQHCLYTFSYSFNAERNIVVTIYEHKECPQHVEVAFVALAVIGGVILIGLAIVIIMRLCMFIKDRRDYAKFVEQCENTNWGTEENPLYKKAMTVYRNPTYGKTD